MSEENSPIKIRAQKYAGIYLSIIFALAIFGAGLVAGKFFWFSGNYTRAAGNADLNSSIIINLDQTKNLSKEVDFDQFWQVWNLVKQKSVKQPVSDSDLFYGAIQGMVYGLKDPYSVYFPPKEAEEFNKDIEGEFSGIGAEVGVKNNQLVIIAPLSGSPAERAGLRAGDAVLMIDKVSTVGMDSGTAVDKIRGKENTKVILTILRVGQSKTKDIEITRAKINIPAVTFSIKNKNVAYLRVMQFNPNTFVELDKAIKQIQDKKITRVVLDMRNNPGGYLDQAILMASEWIPDGKIVSEKFAKGEENTHATVGEHRLANIKTVVLVNSGSASASEIVAGALQDYKKATLVGEKTFGKGSVQDYQTLSDGSGLKITVAEWYTPLEKNINKQGIAPDYEFKQDYDKEKVGEDKMLSAAIGFLNGKKIPVTATTTIKAKIK